jgi:flagellar hook-length control protein FliK
MVATTSPGPAAPTSAPVSQQVFERIERLATSGDGTHRVTLRLDPGTLGEVRVRLTMREGQVRVHLTAGDEARTALAQAAPDLQRLLQAARGDGEVRVDVIAFDRSSQPGGQQTSHSQHDQPHDLPGTPMGSQGSGSGTGQQGAPAGTRRATSARDGDQDRVLGPGSDDPGRPAPHRGVDVQM